MAETKPSPSEILEAVQATGFLMEQRVATQLETLGFHVWTGYPFEDPEESKSREIDVRAYRQVHRDEQSKLNISVEVVCECKNNASPFVFITRKKGEHDDVLFDPCQYLLPFAQYESREGNLIRHRSGFRHFDLHTFHYFYHDEFKAVQFCKVVRKGKEWEANQGGIYDAIFYPLAKMVVATTKLDEKLRNPRTPNDWKNVSLVFPLVVTHGIMYRIDSMIEPLEAKVVSHIPFVRELTSKTVNGQFLVDFVTEKGLPLFINDTLLPFTSMVVHELIQAGERIGSRR